LAEYFFTSLETIYYRSFTDQTFPLSFLNTFYLRALRVLRGLNLFGSGSSGLWTGEKNFSSEFLQQQIIDFLKKYMS